MIHVVAELEQGTLGGVTFHLKGIKSCHNVSCSVTSSFWHKGLDGDHLESCH